MKQNMLLPFVIGGLLLGLLLINPIKKYLKPSSASIITIGIIQTASHPALDQAREGFIQTLQQKLGNAIQFNVHNGQGSLANLHTIAKNLAHNDEVTGIFAIGTPALQAIAAIEKEKPIFISAVTNPHALGLLSADRNICGSTDAITIDDQIDLITHLFANAHKIGILFNTGEVNSVNLVAQMKEALLKSGLTFYEIGITNESEIPMALSSALPQVDVVWAPTDNTVAVAASYIAHKAAELKKPFIASDNLLVQKGACAASGIDYFKSGQQAAQAAIAVLVDHQKPAVLEIATPVIDQIVINKKCMNELGIEIPASLAKKIVIIEGEDL